ncbi:DUF1501 domain-containing protein [Tautonia sp. JC769]|uniref:DUF1501 domain-containing protein n=1 Tax=Tautonia sp. JC769 TaxID=3232135 RepID=UPI0034577290
MTHREHAPTDCEGFHRRDLIRIGASGLLGLGLSDLLRRRSLGARSTPVGRRRAEGVIFLWLAGGPSTIDLWDLKPEAPAEIRGEFRPIDTRSPGLQLCEHLPGLAAVADRITLVRSVEHTITDHEPGTTYMTTGNRPGGPVEYPFLGSLASRLLGSRSGLPAAIVFQSLREGLPARPGHLGPAFAPFEVEGDPSTGPFRGRGVSLPEGLPLHELEGRASLRDRLDRGLAALEGSELLDGLDDFQAGALDLLRSGAVAEALEIDREPELLRDRYGNSPLGRGLLAARRLIEAGTRFVTVSVGGWDTHAGNFDALRDRLIPPLDAALSALIDDLDGRGLLDETIVYCAGEFGRTPAINGNGGRDHWPRSMSVLLAGGSFRRGYVHGETDRTGSAPTVDPCSPDDLSATVFQALGLGDGHELISPSGRPLSLFRDGQVVDALLA